MLQKTTVMLLLLLVSFFITFDHCAGYLATVEIELDGFEVLNDMVISEGDCCDHRGGGQCDLVFYVQNCSRYDGVQYICTTRIDRFEGPKNNDSFRFEYNLRPATAFLIDRFPRELIVNITVYDEDDGYSADDFVGNYIIRFSPNMINNLDTVPGPQEHVITIPGHSRLTLFYRAYCNDAECRQNPVGNFALDEFSPNRQRPLAGPLTNQQAVNQYYRDQVFNQYTSNVYGSGPTSYGEPFRHRRNYAGYF